MSFDFATLGGKLRQARESLLIQPAEAAEQLHISEEEYLRIEAGQRHVSGDEVIVLATLYRRDFRYFVTGDYPSVESQIEEMYRKNGTLSRLDRIAIQEFARICEYQAFLEGILGIQRGSVPDYSRHRFGHAHYKRQGGDAAALERDRLTLGRQPIANIFAVMRQQGIRVFKRQLESRTISGLYLRHPVAGHCVLINYLDDLYRQNFSAAHEYCHALFDSGRGQQVSYWTQHNGPSNLEWRANSFAGNLLVPTERLTQDYRPANTYEEWAQLIPAVARRFGVSCQVVVIRMAEMGWLDRATRDQLMHEQRLAIRGAEKHDPEIPLDLSPGTKARLEEATRRGLSWHFLSLCGEAYRRGEVTYHRVLEMLLLPVDDGMALLSEIPLFLEVSGS